MFRKKKFALHAFKYRDEQFVGGCTYGIKDVIVSFLKDLGYKSKIKIYLFSTITFFQYLKRNKSFLI